MPANAASYCCSTFINILTDPTGIRELYKAIIRLKKLTELLWWASTLAVLHYTFFLMFSFLCVHAASLPLWQWWDQTGKSIKKTLWFDNDMKHPKSFTSVRVPVVRRALVDKVAVFYFLVFGVRGSVIWPIRVAAPVTENHRCLCQIGFRYSGRNAVLWNHLHHSYMQFMTRTTAPWHHVMLHIHAAFASRACCILHDIHAHNVYMYVHVFVPLPLCFLQLHVKKMLGLISILPLF